MDFEMGWKIVEHLAASFLAGALVFMSWLTLLASPLQIHTLTLDRSIYYPGEVVEVVAKGEKPKWSARFCTAVESATYVRDKANRITQFDQPANYNDGSIRKITEKVLAPVEGVPGKFFVSQRVIYRCFGFFYITVSSDPEGQGSAWVTKTGRGK